MARIFAHANVIDFAQIVNCISEEDVALKIGITYPSGRHFAQRGCCRNYKGITGTEIIGGLAKLIEAVADGQKVPDDIAAMLRRIWRAGAGKLA